MPAGARRRAVTMRHTQKPGRMRRNRARRYGHHCGRRIQEETMRNPEIAKNPSTPPSPRNCATAGGGRTVPVSG
jgi:hypothetical protein